VATTLSPAPARPRVPQEAECLRIELALGEMSGEVVARVSGEACVQQAEKLTAALARLNALRLSLITLDLAELNSVSYLALGILASFHRGVVWAGGRVRLAAVLQEPVRQALERTGLLTLVGWPAEGRQSDVAPPLQSGDNCKTRERQVQS